MLFTEKWVFKRHFRNYHADQEFAVCGQPNCQEKFESQQLLKFHMDEAHPDVQNLQENRESEEGDSKCPHCELIFASKMKKDYHIAKKHMSNLLTCTTWQHYTEDLSLLSETYGANSATDGKHFRLEKKGEDAVETWLCDFCPGTFPNLMGIRNHLLKIHYYELKYICEGCDKRFCASLGLHTHRRRCEELKKKNKCVGMRRN
ncbi:Zinc finger and BTB domain-containing protein 40 [Orchesella cincta]|uniref:Zinc finger and BTB domain-containing protein 40 n=1 Tax=Orchesella cincta TaxID=48709 RepID=A0A1D2M2H5_ORCCI|nr:Zinc finger and BTB domain-containing protein 40 [Orchesella cincta]